MTVFTRQNLRRALGLMVIMSVLTACEDEQPPAPQSAPSTTHKTYADTAQGDALGKVNLAGPAGSRITWRLPPTVRPGSPIDVARHLKALVELSAASDTARDPDLASAFAWGSPLDLVRYRMSHKDNGDETGPRRIWLAPFRQQDTPAAVFISVCEDLRGVDYPRSTSRELDLNYWHLERMEDFDGTTAWKVLYEHDPIDDKTSERLLRECVAWASGRPTTMVTSPAPAPRRR